MLDLQDLANGSLTGSKVGTGINANNITAGTLASGRLATTLSGTRTFTSNVRITTGYLRFGSSSPYDYATASPESNLRIVRGLVAANGNEDEGGGYTVSKGATGVYTINFSKAFDDIPTVTVTTTHPLFLAGVLSQSASSAIVTIVNTAGGAVDLRFNFIAIGSR